MRVISTNLFFIFNPIMPSCLVYLNSLYQSITNRKGPVTM